MLNASSYVTDSFANEWNLIVVSIVVKHLQCNLFDEFSLYCSLRFKSSKSHIHKCIAAGSNETARHCWDPQKLLHKPILYSSQFSSWESHSNSTSLLPRTEIKASIWKRLHLIKQWNFLDLFLIPTLILSGRNLLENVLTSPNSHFV